MAVVDDILYVIGGYTAIHIPDSSPMYPVSAMVYSAVNEQYVPIGYSATSLTSKPSTTVTPISSDSIVSPESSIHESFLTVSVMVAIVLIVVVTVSLFLYLRGSKRNKRNKCD